MDKPRAISHFLYYLEHHPALGIGHVDPVLARALLEAPDLRAKIPAGQAPQPAGETTVVDPAREQVIGGQLGQHVGRVHQRVFHRLAHAGLDLGDEHAPQQQRRHRDDEEVSEEDP